MFVGNELGSIAFVNNEIGEIWYQLNLKSEDLAPVKLPVIKTELGKVNFQTVTLSNPLNK